MELSPNKLKIHRSGDISVVVTAFVKIDYDFSEAKQVLFEATYPGNGLHPKNMKILTMDRSMEIEDIETLHLLTEVILDPGDLFLDQFEVSKILDVEKQKEQDQAAMNKKKNRLTLFFRKKPQQQQSQSQSVAGSEEMKMVKKVKAEAIESYTSANPNELSFNKGDVLLVELIGDDRDWFQSKSLDGRVGKVPARLMKLVQTEKKVRKETKLAEVLYDFKGLQADQLTVVAGDKLLVEESVDGWRYGYVDDEEGYVPSSYLKLIAGNESDAGRRVRTMQEAIVLHSYDQDGEGELSLRMNQRVMMDTSPQTDPDWVYVEHQGQSGYFPHAFIRLINENDKLLDQQKEQEKLNDIQRQQQQRQEEEELNRQAKMQEEERLKAETEERKRELSQAQVEYQKRKEMESIMLQRARRLNGAYDSDDE